MDSNTVDFQLNMKVVLEQLNDWFDVNLLVLNSEGGGKQVSFILKQRTLVR